MNVRIPGKVLAEGLVASIVLIVLIVITIPKFERAQDATSVAKAKLDMKLIGDALIAYGKDTGHYPQIHSSNPCEELQPLTTPVAYLNSMPADPFRHEGSKYRSMTSNYDYSKGSTRIEKEEYQTWTLGSLGPDLDEDRSTIYGRSDPKATYDSSNGIISSGDIYWSSYEYPDRLPVSPSAAPPQIIF